MNIRILLIGAITFLLSCNPSSKERNGSEESKSNNKTEMKNNQSDPAWVVNQIFEAAKNKEYQILKELCDPRGQGDGDTKNICSMHSASDKDKAEFDSYFKLGKVIGDPVILGDEAKVQFKFGPDGNKDETMNLVLREGKWYLSSF